MDPNVIGTVDGAAQEVLERERRDEKRESEARKQANMKKKHKMRGRRKVI
jgi:adenylate kinase